MGTSVTIGYQPDHRCYLSGRGQINAQEALGQADRGRYQQIVANARG